MNERKSIEGFVVEAPLPTSVVEEASPLCKRVEELEMELEVNRSE